MQEQKEFTLRELARFDGKEGRPVYVAFGGVVYDVSQSPLWKTGSHFKRHLPGTDLTDQMGCAPHGSDVLGREGIEAVGTLVKEPAQDPVPAFFRILFRYFPSLRRHTHPATVHFPVAFLTAASAFTLLDLLLPGLFGLDHGRTAYLMLALATLSTPAAVATGVVSWWLNYGLRSYKRIRNLIWISGVILVLEVVCVVAGWNGPARGQGAGWLYYGIMLSLGPLASLAGYNGGQMVFPTRKG